MKRDKVKQKDLAEEMFLSDRTISSWVTSRTEPTIDQLIDIANFFDVTVGQLLGTERIEL